MAEKSNPYASAAESYEAKESQPWVSGMGKDMAAQQGSPSASVTERRPLVSRNHYMPCPLPVQYHENVFMTWLTRIFLLVAIFNGFFVYGMSHFYIAKLLLRIYGQSIMPIIRYFAHEFYGWTNYLIFAAYILASVLLYVLCKRPSHGYNKTRMFMLAWCFTHDGVSLALMFGVITEVRRNASDVRRSTKCSNQSELAAENLAGREIASYKTHGENE